MNGNTLTEQPGPVDTISANLATLADTRPAAARRVAVELGCLRCCSWASATPAGHAHRVSLVSAESSPSPEDARLAMVCAGILCGLDPSAPVDTVSRQAWANSLRAAWGEVIGAPWPGGGAWRNLRVEGWTHGGGTAAALARSVGLAESTVQARARGLAYRHLHAAPAADNDHNPPPVVELNNATGLDWSAAALVARLSRPDHNERPSLSGRLAHLLQHGPESR